MKLTNAADERLATITRKVIVFSAKENGDYFFSEFMKARRIMITVFCTVKTIISIS